MILRKTRHILVVVATLVCGAGLILADAGSPPNETFDGAPAAPQPYSDPHWDIQYHQRDNYAWQNPIPVAAHHGPACEAPDVTHQVTSFEGLVFKCNNHLMTAIDGGEYGMIYLTPDRMADWSSGTAVIEWDMSTFRSSNRDWIDVWVTPLADNLVLPLDNDIPDAQGTPRNAIHIRMDGSGTAGPLDGGFKIFVYQNGSLVSPASTNTTWNPYNDFLQTDKARRDTFRLEISRTTINLTMPGYNQTLQRATGLNLGFSSGVVQLGHHSYNPRKDGGVPNTWHWDSVNISPSIPLTMLHGDRRTVDGSSPQTVRFAGPAPANSYLRFAAQGRVEYSLNGGSSWQVASKQWAAQPQVFTFSNYFVPIPAGTQEVTFRLSAEGGLPPPFQAKGFAIWSTSASGAPPATATPTRTPTSPAPTATPTRTPTSPAPTATPTRTPTSPAPTATPTRTPTSPAPTATPTRTPTSPAPTATPTRTPTSPAPTATPTRTPTQQAQTVTVRGQVTLDGRSNASGALVTAMPGGFTARPLANGTFTFSGLNPNTTYTFSITAPGYLPTNKNLRPGSNPSPLPGVKLRAGDVTGNGQVDITDISLLSSWFSIKPNDARLDFNQNGVVDITDISIAAANFGLRGPTPW